MPGDGRERKDRLLAEAGRHLGYGLTWALSTALFLLLGWVVDGWLGTRPLFTILGAFVGAGAGFYSLYHHLVEAPGGRADRDASGGHDDAAGRHDDASGRHDDAAGRTGSRARRAREERSPPEEES